MPQIKPGDIIYSARHKCLLYCCGRNGGRPHEMLGHVVRSGVPDQDTYKIFEAADVAAIQTPEGLLTVMPGTVGHTWNDPYRYPSGDNRPSQDFVEYVRELLCGIAKSFGLSPDEMIKDIPHPSPSCNQGEKL